MREIKFKIWLPAVKKMTHALSIYDWVQCGFNGQISNDDVFLQCTGLKDKNGVEIYEGDILHSEFNEKFDIDGRSTGPQLSWRREQVVFHENGFYSVVRSHFNSYFGEIPSKPSIIHFSVFEKFQNHYTVLGNIYENPNLIQK